MACDPQQVPAYRYVTTENIHAGDVILEEEPWMWSLLCLNEKFAEGGPDTMVCHYCLLSPGKLSVCSACKSAWYCSAACQRADWNLRHKHGDCSMQKVIARSKICVETVKNKNSIVPHERLRVIRRLLLSSASIRLFSTKQRNENGYPDSALWHALLDSVSNTDGWVDVEWKPFSDFATSETYTKLVRAITWKDQPNKLIEKRILPSLVLMRDYGPWKEFLKSMQLPTTTVQSPPKYSAELALGACLEMSKFPNNCSPNAVVINEGRLVRMIAVEDIPNLDAVRLWRGRNCLETRYLRRTRDLYDTFGFDCYCSRCCAGDSGETAMYALRCPKWAAAFNGIIQNKSTGCDGIVTGLRRTDIETFGISAASIMAYGAEAAAVMDEPRPLSAEVLKKPAHERAECQKCHAHYDETTMKRHILKCLVFLTRLNFGLDDSMHLDEPEMFAEMTAKCEQYIHPNNYTFTTADQMLLGHFNDVKSLAWLQRNSRRMLARMEGDGFKQLDLQETFRVAQVYYMSAHILRRDYGATANTGTGERNLYVQTAELVERVVKAAVEKLKPLLFHELN